MLEILNQSGSKGWYQGINQRWINFVDDNLKNKKLIKKSITDRAGTTEGYFAISISSLPFSTMWGSPWGGVK